MADEEECSRRSLNTKVPFTGRIATRLPSNPLSRLQYREIGGLHRQHQRSVNTQLFQKLPGRLGFSLRSLVDESVLHEGHVFMGFTKNGHFVLSYTLNVEADEHTAYPIYVYRLQWWRFIPYKRLKLTSEIRLFGEEDIQQDLFITISEWPTDDTRVVVHGQTRAPRDNEEKHQCYVSILAVPPVGPCEDCNQLAILQAQRGGFHGNFYEVAPRCLNHNFAVHTKYELAPPYPTFAPKVFLKLDGVIVMNTGDSLIALSMNLEDNHGGFGFGVGFYSPRVTRSVSNLSTASSDDRMSYESREMLDVHMLEVDSSSHIDNALTVFPPFLAQSPPSTSNVLRSPSAPNRPKDTTNTPCVSDYRLPVARERHASTGKENLLNNPLGSPKSSSDTGAHCSGRHESQRSHRSLDVYNFEGFTPKKNDDTGESTPDSVPSTPTGKTPLRATLAFQQGARMQHSSTGEINLHSNDTLDSQTLEDLDNKADIFEKPSGVLRLQTRESPGSSSSARIGSLMSPPESFPLGKGLCFSPGYGKFEGGSSTCSSCMSSPIILQSDSQCFTYSVRRYIDCYAARPDSPVEVEDDLSLAYHSVLPLEVHGANYCNMRLLTKQCLTPQMPSVVVKQLTLDIEHYLGETVRTTAEWGHRYLAFTDYDVQVVEVSPNTSEVIAMVFVLIRARPPKDSRNSHHHGRTVPKLYQSGFKLIWNLTTGSYTTLDVEDLVEINQSEFLRKRWHHPGNSICDALQRRFAIPQLYSRSVHVLTNEAVFRGQSLKMLVDRHHYVAILL